MKYPFPFTSQSINLNTRNFFLFPKLISFIFSQYDNDNSCWPKTTPRQWKLKCFKQQNRGLLFFCTENRSNKKFFFYFVTNFLQNSNYHKIINYRAIGFSFIWAYRCDTLFYVFRFSILKKKYIKFLLM